MATRIRLARGGRKKRPYFRIVVADSRAPRDGRFIERIGSYDPLLAENKVTVNEERARHWLDVGAQPSHRVSRLLALQGMEHKLIVLPVPKAQQEPAKAAKRGKAGKAEVKAEDKAEAKAPEAAEAKAAEKDEPKAEAKAAEPASEAEAPAEGAEPAAEPAPEEPAS